LPATRASGPAVDPLPCSGCGKLIDPLRAGQVAIFDLRFHYFCNARCRLAFVGEAAPQLPQAEADEGAAHRRLAAIEPGAPEAPAPHGVDEPAPRIAELDAPILDAYPPVALDSHLPEPPATGDDRALLEPIGKTILDAGGGAGAPLGDDAQLH
jgi:Cu+-exporting ATPase